MGRVKYKGTRQCVEGEQQVMRRDISIERHEAACANRGALAIV